MWFIEDKEIIKDIKTRKVLRGHKLMLEINKNVCYKNNKSKSNFGIFKISNI